MTDSYSADDIAIVGVSCVLPDALLPETFWKNIFSETSAIKEITEERLKSFILEDKGTSRLKIISRLAAEVSHDDYEKILASLGDSARKLNRLRNYALSASRKLMEKIPVSSRGKIQDIILGCMNGDISFELQFLQSREKEHVNLLRKLFQDATPDEKKVLEEILESALLKHIRNHEPDPGDYFTTSVLALISDEQKFQGEQFLVDTACASSLTAIDLAAQRLRLGECDFAISGGMESNLGQATYIIFSAVGALAPEQSMPFDKKTQGLAQSEGAVFYALKRIRDAVRDGDHIHGVIRGIAGSSDGRSASLFQPNVNGQKLVYQKVHGKNKKLHYLEAHGTGTQVGDETEMKSITGYFSGEKIPVGSVKALLGHTKGAAGATGLLKSLLIMKHRQVPASSYVSESLFPGDDSPYMNRERLTLPTNERLRVGVNSFGFGGTNYHLLAEEWIPGSEIADSAPLTSVSSGVIAESSLSLLDFEREDFLKFDCPFKLPPKSIAAIDKVQLLALITTWECIKKLGPTWDWIPKEKINVVSACTLGLDQVFELADRLIFEIVARFGESRYPGHPVSDKLRNFVNTDIEKRYAPVNEDAATGILNNVIAGRVSNAFDLFGKTYNIDKDLASIPVTLQAVRNELKLDPDQMFIVIGVEETLSPDGFRTHRTGVTTRILTSRTFAEENEFEILSEVL